MMTKPCERCHSPADFGFVFGQEMCTTCYNEQVAKNLHTQDSEWNKRNYPRLVENEYFRLKAREDAKLRYDSEQDEHESLTDAVFDLEQLALLPKPEPLIADTIDLATVALISGYWGTCKSFLAIDFAACVATGKPWQSREIKQTGKVLYVAAEGAHGLHDRIVSWQTGWQQQIDKDALKVMIARPHLARATDVDELCSIVADGGYLLVVVDTLAKCTPGIDENSAKDMGKVVESLYRVRQATGNGTVLAIHHTGKDKTTVRGSSALESGVDTVYLTEGSPDELKVSRTKRKDGPTTDEMTLCLSPVAYTQSAILEGGASPFIMSGTSTGQTVLSAFLSAFKATGCTKSELRKIVDLAPSSFHRGINALVEDGILVNTGTDKRPFYVLANKP